MRAVAQRYGSVPAGGAARNVQRMDDLTTPLGIALIALGVFAAIKAAKAVVKLTMLAIIVIGLYLWFGAG